MSKHDIKKALNNTRLELPVASSDFAEELPKRCEPITYPLDALGQILGDAAKQIAYHVQVPIGMAAQSVLATAALIAQGHINVQRGTIGLGPVSLYCLTVAESGDRKSAVDRLALKPIRDFEQERMQAVADEEKRYKAELKSWEMRRESLTKTHDKVGEMSEATQTNLANKLYELEQTKPHPPLRPNIIFSEPTAEGVWKHYIDGLPSAGLFSDEGISFFGGHGFSDDAKGRTVHLKCKLWDGDPLTRTRGADGQSGLLVCRRLSSHLMVQPIVSAGVLADPLLQGQGFLARFLICHEPSIAGSRLLRGRDLSKGSCNDPSIMKYWEKMTDLLDRPLNINNKTGGLELTVSSLRGDVFEMWCSIHDNIENELKPNGCYVDIKAFASKAPEYVARIAAILAFVEGDANPTIEHVQRAGVIVSYYLDAMRGRTLEAQEDATALDAGILLEWMKARGGRLSSSEFNSLPNHLRPAAAARNVLSYLVNTGHIVVSEKNRRTKDKPSAWEVIK